MVDGLLAGRHRGGREGFTVEFADHRPYSPGDDPRAVDWRLFARTGELHLKRFEQETNLAVHLVLDASGSMTFRGQDAAWSKWGCAATLAATLAALVLRGRDAVGLTVLGRPGADRPPSAAATHLENLCAALGTVAPAGEADLSAAVPAAAMWRRRGVAVLIGDLFDDPDRLAAVLADLARRRHRVAVLRVLDPEEVSPPLTAATRFVPLEGGPPVLADARLRDAYRAAFERHDRLLTAACRRSGAAFTTALTDVRPGAVLGRFLRGMSP